MDNQQIFNLDIEMLQPNPLQPRGLISPETLVELIDSIREHGILEPLVVAQTPAGYQIIAGERRWRAAKIAGLHKVPTVIKQTSNRGMLEMAIVENVQRQDLNPLERAQAFKRLEEEFGLSVNEVAIRVGKSGSYVSNTMRLLALPDALKDALLSGDVTEGHIRALAGIEDTGLMVEALKKILQENANVRRAEELARQYKQKVKKETPRTQQDPVYSEEITQMEKDLSKALAGHVKISQSGRQAKVILQINGNTEKTTKILQEIYKLLKSLESLNN